MCRHLWRWLLLRTLLLLVTSGGGGSGGGVSQIAAAAEPCSTMWRGGKQTADCMGLGLRAVPPSLNTAVQVLNLSKNPLDHLAARAFQQAGLVNLQRLYLRQCRLRAIDGAALAGLTNLVLLDLAGNQLATVPSAALGAAVALRELILDGNAIRTLNDSDLAGQRELVELSMANCQLQQVGAAAFDPVTKIKKLSLRGNLLQEVPERAVVALKNLHNIELDANPWHCDCRLQPLFKWLSSEQVPYLVAPTCVGPARVAGLQFNSMVLSQFACRPQLLPMEHNVLATLGENATLSCQIAAMPRPTITWYYNGHQLVNGSRLHREFSRAFFTYEEGDTDLVSRLVIPNVHTDDTLYDFVCVGENDAGKVETAFTVSAGRRLALLMPLDSSQIAGIVVGLLLLLVVVVALTFIGLAHQRRKRADSVKLATNGAKTLVQSNGGHHNVVAIEATAEEDMVNPVQKPPRLSDFGLAPHSHPAGVGVASNGAVCSSALQLYSDPRYSSANVQNSIYVRGPDLIRELDSGQTSSYDVMSYYSPAYLTDSRSGVKNGIVNPMADESYELSQLHSELESEQDRLNPSIYGYPADYGLPIPESQLDLEQSGASNYGMISYRTIPSNCSSSSLQHQPPPEPAPESHHDHYRQLQLQQQHRHPEQRHPPSHLHYPQPRHSNPYQQQQSQHHQQHHQQQQQQQQQQNGSYLHDGDSTMISTAGAGSSSFVPDRDVDSHQSLTTVVEGGGGAADVASDGRLSGRHVAISAPAPPTPPAPPVALHSRQSDTATDV